VNVCYVLQASDTSGCFMSSNDISSLYMAPAHFVSLDEVLAETSLARVTFDGRVIHSTVCMHFCIERVLRLLCMR